MKVTVWKNEKESNERTVTRFNKIVQASRKLVLVRGKQYYARKPTVKYVRNAALMRAKYRGLKEKNKFY